MANTTVVILPRSFGDVNEYWIPYLKENLQSDSCNDIVPQFPIGDKQNLNSRKQTFNDQVRELTKDTVLVGHSIAPAFILSLLNESEVCVKGIVFVSGFLRDLGVEEFDKVNTTFTHASFNWGLIKNNFSNAYAFHSDDDPYVPIWMGQEIADKLNIELKPIKHGGHLNIAAGFKEFPLLLDKANEFVSK
jgi:predicted alpha/beta hydrolase family esterase